MKETDPPADPAHPDDDEYPEKLTQALRKLQYGLDARIRELGTAVQLAKQTGYTELRLPARTSSEKSVTETQISRIKSKTATGPHEKEELPLSDQTLAICRAARLSEDETLKVVSIALLDQCRTKDTFDAVRKIVVKAFEDVRTNSHGAVLTASGHDATGVVSCITAILHTEKYNIIRINQPLSMPEFWLTIFFERADKSPIDRGASAEIERKVRTAIENLYKRDQQFDGKVPKFLVSVRGFE